MVVSIECRDHKRPADVGWVDACGGGGVATVSPSSLEHRGVADGDHPVPIDLEILLQPLPSSDMQSHPDMKGGSSRRRANHTTILPGEDAGCAGFDGSGAAAVVSSGRKSRRVLAKNDVEDPEREVGRRGHKGQAIRIFEGCSMGRKKSMPS